MRGAILRRFTGLLVATALLVGNMLPVFGAIGVPNGATLGYCDVGPFTVAGNAGDFRYDAPSGVLSLSGSGQFSLANKNTALQATESVTLSGSPTVLLNGLSTRGTATASPLSIAPGSNVTLILKDGSRNVLSAGAPDRAGISLPSGASLTLLCETAANTGLSHSCTPSCGSLQVEGNGGGAGVGGNGSGTLLPPAGAGETAGALAVRGGYFSFAGGRAGASGGGAAIGGGGGADGNIAIGGTAANGGSGGAVSITGGNVRLSAAAGAAAIGGGGGGRGVASMGGSGGNGGSVEVENVMIEGQIGGGTAGAGSGGSTAAPGTLRTKNAVVKAPNTLLGGTFTDSVIFQQNNGVVYGNAFLPVDLAVLSGERLVVPQGSILGVPAEITLENRGVLENLGLIQNVGSFENSSSFLPGAGSYIEGTGAFRGIVTAAITMQPVAAQNVQQGRSAALSVSARSSDATRPLSVQWYQVRGNALLPIVGATSPAYLTPVNMPAGVEQYSCEVLSADRYRVRSTLAQVTTTQGSIGAVTVTPTGVLLPKGGSLQLTAKIDGVAAPSGAIRWAVHGAANSYTNVDQSGWLQVSSNETSSQLQVTATSVVDTKKYATAHISITNGNNNNFQPSTSTPRPSSTPTPTPDIDPEDVNTLAKQSDSLFWKNMLEKLRSAKQGSTIRARTDEFTQMPADVMQALWERADLTLSLEWVGGTLVIPPGKAKKQETGRTNWSLSELMEEYTDESTKPVTQSELATPTPPPPEASPLPVAGEGTPTPTPSPSPAATPTPEETITEGIVPPQPPVSAEQNAQLITAQDSGASLEEGTVKQPKKPLSSQDMLLIVGAVTALVVVGGSLGAYLLFQRNHP